jgi:hypothetical protein
MSENLDCTIALGYILENDNLYYDPQTFYKGGPKLMSPGKLNDVLNPKSLILS